MHHFSQKKDLLLGEPAVLWSGPHAALQQPAGPPGQQHINSDHGAVIRMSPDEVIATVQVEGHVQSRWHMSLHSRIMLITNYNPPQCNVK